MIHIYNLEDLRPYGITILTGEACGINQRILCDVTEQGKQYVEQYLGCTLNLQEPWNSGGIGSIMLALNTLRDIGTFIMAQVCDIAILGDGGIYGVSREEMQDIHPAARQAMFGKHFTSYQRQGNARNGNSHVHVMSGRAA